MNVYREIFEFAASAGALEGYLFKKERVTPEEIDDWIHNLMKQHQRMPPDVREHYQGSLDRTMGRAVHSLTALFGPTHPHVLNLKSMVKGEMPAASNDFEREKAEKAAKY